MRKYGLILIAAALALAFAHQRPPQPAPAQGAEKAAAKKAGDDAEAKLAALTKRLPELVGDGFRAAYPGGLDGPAREWVKVRLARQTSATEAKVILQLDAPEGTVYEGRSLFILHLRYHAGMWTTLRSEGALGALTNASANWEVRPFIELAIDKSQGK